MTPSDASRELEQVARDLDLVVFALERAPAPDPAAERTRLRRDLERLRDRLTDLSRVLDRP